MTGASANADPGERAEAALFSTIVLFDWNGTIVVDGDRARAALNSALEPHGLAHLDEETFAERFRLPMRDLLAGLGVAELQLARAESDWNRAMASASAPARDGVRAAMTALRAGGAAVGVVSAASRVAVLADIGRLGLEGLFDVVEGGCIDKSTALTRLRGHHERAAYVGDTEYDIRSALAAGFQPIGVHRGYTTAARLLAAGADVLVDDLRELLALPHLGRPGRPERRPLRRN